jgi:hypothetical protein
VRRADELTTHDRAHGAEAMDGRAEASRETRQTRTQIHTDDMHDSHRRRIMARDGRTTLVLEEDV